MLAVSGGVGLPREPPLGTNSARAVGGLQSPTRNIHQLCVPYFSIEHMSWLLRPCLRTFEFSTRESSWWFQELPTAHGKLCTVLLLLLLLSTAAVVDAIYCSGWLKKFAYEEVIQIRRKITFSVVSIWYKTCSLTMGKGQCVEACVV
jgi:hypothetical protein